MAQYRLCRQAALLAPWQRALFRQTLLEQAAHAGRVGPGVEAPTSAKGPFRDPHLLDGRPSVRPAAAEEVARGVVPHERAVHLEAAPVRIPGVAPGPLVPLEAAPLALVRRVVRLDSCSNRTDAPLLQHLQPCRRGPASGGIDRRWASWPRPSAAAIATSRSGSAGSCGRRLSRPAWREPAPTPGPRARSLRRRGREALRQRQADRRVFRARSTPPFVRSSGPGAMFRSALRSRFVLRRFLDPVGFGRRTAHILSRRRAYPGNDDGRFPLEIVKPP